MLLLLHDSLIIPNFNIRTWCSVGITDECYICPSACRPRSDTSTHRSDISWFQSHTSPALHMKLSPFSIAKSCRRGGVHWRTCFQLDNAIGCLPNAHWLHFSITSKPRKTSYVAFLCLGICHHHHNHFSCRSQNGC